MLSCAAKPTSTRYRCLLAGGRLSALPRWLTCWAGGGGQALQRAGLVEAGKSLSHGRGTRSWHDVNLRGFAVWVNGQMQVHGH